MDSVLTRLQEQNLIKNSFLVSLHARISGLTQTWEGVFTLNDSMSADEILRCLNDADQAKTTRRSSRSQREAGQRIMRR